MLKKHVAISMTWAALAALPACGMEPSEVSDATRELRAATDRIRELRKARPGGATSGLQRTEPVDSTIVLDVREPDQKHFVETRLRYAGKTPENSPNLFSRLDRQSKRAKAEPAPTQQVDALNCDNPLSYTQNPNNQNLYEARIITSCFDGAEYSYVDLFWWNTATGEILAYDFRENFDNPTDITLEIEANSAEIGTTIQVDSMAINSRGAEDYYGFDDILTQRPDTLSLLDNVFHPSDQNVDGTVVSCLDRGGSDCDYYFTNTNANIMIPINMSFRFPGVVTQVMSAIGQIHMTNSGGVCQTADLTNFATIAGAVVTLNTGGPISFGTKCVANQVAVRFWVMITAKNSRGDWYYMFWANDRPTDPKRFAMQFRWSCLAEGSKIVMADGTEKLIEQVELGDRVRSGAPGTSLSVVDITSGFESAPIVELESDNGSTLLVTQGHPFFDADGRALRADELKVGSAIKTSTGTTKITRLNRKPYAGKVYNLKLGTEQQIEGLNVGAINMYANGLSVGDSRSQWALEVVRQQQASSAPLRAEWKQDHLMHNVRKAFGVRAGL